MPPKPPYTIVLFTLIVLLGASAAHGQNWAGPPGNESAGSKVAGEPTFLLAFI